ncbi:MAG: [acyl-carrier-protein] S-malonyltransferase [Dehalococcoidia bacterium]|nr:[acyl-carrier-protein] S-malonyltransferase [Dehalococcoidia bacterium]
MGKDLFEKSAAARHVFEEADQALGFPLTHLMFEGPSEELMRTINSQPAILTVSLACLAAAEEEVGEPLGRHVRFVAGHSLGEYSALAAAGVLETSEVVWLVRERGRVMQEACDQVPGSMAAILGLEETAIREICRETGTQVANINAPGQIVISGESEGVARAIDLAKERGAKRAIPLSVSGAFHSYLMAPALNDMIKALDAVHFRNPVTPVIANCTSKPLTSATDVKEELVQQLCGCVRWRDGIACMTEAGVTSFVEFGQGRVLSGMVKRIADDAHIANVNGIESAHSLLGGS